MSNLQDALYNWLTIKVVVDERPQDTAALETERMFYSMLVNDHQISSIEVTTDAVMYYVHYEVNGEKKLNRYPRELIEIMLNQINESPERYANFE